MYRRVILVVGIEMVIHLWLLVTSLFKCNLTIGDCWLLLTLEF